MSEQRAKLIKEIGDIVAANEAFLAHPQEFNEDERFPFALLADICVQYCNDPSRVTEDGQLEDSYKRLEKCSANQASGLRRSLRFLRSWV